MQRLGWRRAPRCVLPGLQFTGAEPCISGLEALISRGAPSRACVDCTLGCAGWGYATDCNLGYSLLWAGQGQAFRAAGLGFILVFLRQGTNIAS